MDHNLLISILDFKGLSIQSLFLKILTLLGLPRDPLSSSHMVVAPRFDPWVGKIPLEKGMVTHSSIPA